MGGEAVLAVLAVLRCDGLSRHGGLIERLHTSHTGISLASVRFYPGGEPLKICVHDGDVSELGEVMGASPLHKLSE